MHLLEWVIILLRLRELTKSVAVVEGVDDWTDLIYILCNNSHSQFVAEKGDIVGQKLKEIKHVDLKAAGVFIGACKGNLS
jgi:hypothetical protein